MRIESTAWPSDVVYLYWTLYLKKATELIPMAKVPRPVRVAGRRILDKLQTLGA